MIECPWSSKQLRRLGEHIRDASIDTPTPEHLPDYDDVMLWYNDFAVAVQREIEALDFTALLGERRPEITSRAKTIDTLRDKLRRDRATPLSSVQDVAGVRFEAEMTLDEQDAVVTAIAGRFDHPLTPRIVHDLREAPHSGYRAVHLWLTVAGRRVEVQVRTHLQGEWANVYEAAADVLGREIRYGSLPVDERERLLITGLHALSVDDVATVERLKNTAARVILTAEEFEARFGDEARVILDSEMLRSTADVATQSALYENRTMGRLLRIKAALRKARG